MATEDTNRQTVTVLQTWPLRMATGLTVVEGTAQSTVVPVGAQRTMVFMKLKLPQNVQRMVPLLAMRV